MRILQIVPKPPLPSVDGGTLAMHSITEALLKQHTESPYQNEVMVLAISTKKHPFLTAQMPAAYKLKTKIEAVFINTNVTFFSALFNLFSSSCYNVNRFYSLNFERKLITILQKNTFDIIQLESLYIASYIDVIRKNSKAKIILRAHNVESELWKRRTLIEKNSFKRSWFKHLTKNLSTCEVSSLKKVDAIIPITQQDAESISTLLDGTKKPMLVLPFAMELSSTISYLKKEKGTVFHIGAMDWIENSEGVKWLMHKVWPLVISKIPYATLHLAGRGLTQGDETYYGENIFNHGEVESAEQFMNKFEVMAIPLLSGGGMRVKLVEGMALGKAIVSTSIGAEGTATENGKELLIENEALDFANAICNLIHNPIFAEELGKRANKFALEHFNLSESSKKLNEFYTSLIQ